VAEGQETYQNEVAAIIQAAPDAIFYAGYEIEAPYLRADLVAAGVAAPMLASDGAFLSATIDEAGGAAEGMYISSFAPSPETVVDEAWVKAYQAVDYRNPDTYSINGYAALQVLTEGVKQARSFEAAQIAETLRTHTLNTLLGALQYDVNGDVMDAKVYVFQVREGAFVQVYPAP